MWEFPKGSLLCSSSPSATCISKMVYKFGLTSKYFIDKAHKCVSKSLDSDEARELFKEANGEKGFLQL